MAIQFRTEALNKLSSPDDLDRMMSVTDRRGWISLSATALVIVAALIWGYFGQISTMVVGQGITMSEGAIQSITARTSGILSGFTVIGGQTIQKGQIIAIIEQPELRQSFIEDFSTYEFLSSREREQKEFFRRQIEIQEEKLRKLGSLYKEGLVEKSLITTAERDVMDLKNNLYQFDEKVTQAQRQLSKSRENYKWRSAVVAPFSGAVTEVHFKNGEQVNEGSELLFAEPYGQADAQSLSLSLFVASGDAKKIRNGMEVFIALATVKPEQYGYVIGKVYYVSEYPKSLQAIASDLKNDLLAQTFSRSSSPYKVKIKLLRDSSTYSGYRWTSGKGPRISITSGILCSGQIIVEQQRPMELVIPMLKKYVIGIAG